MTQPHCRRILWRRAYIIISTFRRTRHSHTSQISCIGHSAWWWYHLDLPGECPTQGIAQTSHVEVRQSWVYSGVQPEIRWWNYSMWLSLCCKVWISGNCSQQCKLTKNEWYFLTRSFNRYVARLTIAVREGIWLNFCRLKSMFTMQGQPKRRKCSGPGTGVL